MNGVFPDLATAVDPPVEPARSRLTSYFWAWPAGLMLIVAMYQITRPAWWADELATWGAVRLGWGGLFRLLGNVGAVVGPYFTLMKAWTTVAGTSTFALRLPSALAMVAATALLTILGGRLAGRRVGLLAGFAFALVPATSRYAQAAGPYAFVILFAIVATLALTRLLGRPSWPRALLYGGSVTVLGAFHLVALLLLVAHGIVVGLRRDRGRLIAWAVAAGAALVLLAPLAWLGHRQSAQISWLEPATWRTLVGVPDTIFGVGVVGGFVIALGLLTGVREQASAPLPVGPKYPSAPALLAGTLAVAPLLALFPIR